MSSLRIKNNVPALNSASSASWSLSVSSSAGGWRSSRRCWRGNDSDSLPTLRSRPASAEAIHRISCSNKPWTANDA